MEKNKKLIDGCYYKCSCLKCGLVDAAYIRSSKTFLCSKCNSCFKVKLIGGEKNGKN